MTDKKIDAMLPAMRIAKIVRETAGLTAWKMHQRMGKKSVQAYLSLERSAKRISLIDFYRLEDVWVEEGCGSREEFHALARKTAKKIT